jgi:photosystem II stability/assembly factor-like uncharacterized protein
MKRFSTLFFIFCLTATIQAQWTVIPLLTNDAIVSFSFPTAHTGYVVTSNSDILKTTNDGQTWTKIYDSAAQPPLASYFFNDITFVNETTGYAVGTRFFGGDYLIIKTTDGGLTWGQPTITASNVALSTWRSVQFITPQYGFVVGEGGLWAKTTDGGATWLDRILPDRTDLRYVQFVNAFEGFILSRGGVLYKTTDGGISWTKPTLPEPFVKSFFLDAQTGFASGYRVMYKTTNAGQSWQSLGDSVDIGIDANNIRFFDTLNGVITLGGKTYKTLDGGKTRLKQSIINSDTSYYIQRTAFLNPNIGFASGYFFTNTGLKPVLLKTTNGGGLSAGISLSRKYVSCPISGTITATPTFSTPPTSVEWYLDSTLISRSRDSVTFPAPTNHQLFYTISLIARSPQGNIKVEQILESETTTPSQPPMTVDSRPCKGSSAKITVGINIDNNRYPYQLLKGNTVVAGPKILDGFTRTNFFDTPPVDDSTTFRLQMLHSCGIVEAGSITIVPQPVSRDNYHVSVNSPLILCKHDNIVKIKISPIDSQLLWRVEQNGVPIGEFYNYEDTIVFTSNKFDTTTVFKVFGRQDFYCWTLQKDSIRIQVERPSARFALEKANFAYSTPIAVKFEGEESTLFNWSFGNRATPSVFSQKQPPLIAFNNTDTAIIRLITTAPLGCKDTVQKRIGFYNEQNLTPYWTQTTNLAPANVTNAQLLEVDQQGNMILASTGNKGTIIPSRAGSFVEKQADGQCLFKYSPKGVLLWQIDMGQKETWVGFRDIKTDGNGNIFVSMSFDRDIVLGSMDEKRQQKKMSSYLQSSMVAKYNSAGKLLWSVDLNSPTGSGGPWVEDIEIDSTGKAYILIENWNSRDLTLTSVDNSTLQISDTHGRLILAMLSPDGKFLGYKLLYDEDVSGHSDGLTIDKPHKVLYLNANSGLIKLDLAGNELWRLAPTAVSFGGGFGSQSATIDSLGNIYLVGALKGSITFAGFPEMFGPMVLMKINPTGQIVWIKKSTTTNGGEFRIGSAISYSNGAVYVSGTFSGNFRYDNLNINLANREGALLLCVNAQTGNYISHIAFGKEDPNYPNYPNGSPYYSAVLKRSLKVDNQNVIYWIGSSEYRTNVNDTLSFDPPMFIARIKPITGNIAPLSVRDVPTDLKATIAPNPTNGFVEIKLTFNRPFRAHEKLIISDALGRQVQIYAIDKDNKLDISTLPNGIYFVQVALDDGFYTLDKIMKFN